MDTDTPLTTAADTPLPATNIPLLVTDTPLLVTDTPLPVTGTRPAADAFPAPLPGGVR
ncbi:hypothetical protein [Streptomyces sp. BBFR115]|uniref:hypothetical protein n=1 Tax=Streptomyces sp. BBFR115 TaxID=3448173 RepID=UPI003F758E93